MHDQLVATHASPPLCSVHEPMRQMLPHVPQRVSLSADRQLPPQQMSASLPPHPHGALSGEVAYEHEPGELQVAIRHVWGLHVETTVQTPLALHVSQVALFPSVEHVVPSGRGDHAVVLVAGVHT